MTPTKRSAAGSGMDKDRTGIIIVDVPNPDAVPTSEATSVTKTRSNSCAIYL
jgi:hypothetical protein